MRGAIRNPERIARLRDFTGLRWGAITPTDIDAALDFGGKAFVLIEGKFGNAPLPFGQRLALERFVDAWERAGVRAIAIVIRHEEIEPIDYAACPVVSYRWRGKWNDTSKNIPCKEFIDLWRAAGIK